ncbi:YihY/virulence factor BrkB family protein [Paracoccus aerodenitrificans]|uniref:YihY/virulence factor BrkB family protein n=1 Tax=Paracoccus aerodenitrificans TaxID=3017781 RepID=UPI0022F06534|nr:YihY/virulence factor BrkB family protein [Paracoccus aerodenitrificans]WBU64150.1 YihY/virulence factor BrkB family protein [Paracoccus aerodenitrificans]
MARAPERSIGDALFGPLPDEVRRRFDLDEKPPAPPAAKRVREGDPDADLPAPRSDAPDSPWGLRPKEWWGVLKGVVTEIGEDRVTSVAGGVTFFGLLALFPAITALVSIFGLVADPEVIAEQMDNLSSVIPPAAFEIINGQVEAIINSPGTALSFAGIIGLFLTLWSANGGMKALMDALNVAWFQRESRGFFKLNLVSLTMTLGAIVLVMALVGTIAVLPAVLNWLPLPDATKDMVSMIRWPIMFAVLFLAISALYRWGPSRNDANFNWFSPGALFASVGLVAASALFSFYASNFANYNQTYGTLGAVIVLMMWLWISAIVVLVGAEINAVAERHLRALNGETRPS